VSTATADEIQKEIKELRRQAEKLVREKKIDDAAKIYTRISQIHEKVLKEEPENKFYSTNYKYYLSKIGMVQIKYANKMEKEKRYDIAARYYASALKAFEDALKKVPGTKTFEQNIKYCRYRLDRASYNDMLSRHTRAPDFTVTSVKDGSRISLADFKGSPVLLVIWAAWCPHSRKAMSGLKEKSAQFKKRGIEIVSVTLDRVEGWKKRESDIRAEEIARELPFPVGWATESFSGSYPVSGVPTFLLLDREFNLLKKIPFDGDILKEAVSAL